MSIVVQKQQKINTKKTLEKQHLRKLLCIQQKYTLKKTAQQKNQ